MKSGKSSRRIWGVWTLKACLMERTLHALNAVRCLQRYGIFSNISNNFTLRKKSGPFGIRPDLYKSRLLTQFLFIPCYLLAVGGSNLVLNVKSGKAQARLDFTQRPAFNSRIGVSMPRGIFLVTCLKSQILFQNHPT